MLKEKKIGFEVEKEIIYDNREISLITTEGREIVIKYKIDEDLDDYVMDETRRAVINNEILCLEEYCDVDVKFGEQYISELDCKKIIGIKW